MKYTYAINNLCCETTAGKIEKEINKNESLKAKVKFASQKLVIDSDSKINLEEIKKAIQKVNPKVTIEDKKHSSECECCKVNNKNTKKASQSKNRIIPIKDIALIVVGLAIAILGYVFIDRYFYLGLAMFIVAYIILGYDIVISAFKNILKGGFLDENFLMTIATLGAFAIQQYPEAIGIVLFYKIGESFEHYSVRKSRNSITEALDVREDSVIVIDKNGKQNKTIIENINIGQTILIKPGDRVPLDGIVLKGESYLDTSSITGESVYKKVKTGDQIYSGSINKNSVLEIKITNDISTSMVTRILESVENASETKPRMDRFITKFSKIYTPIIVVLALLVAIVPPLINGEWDKWITSALTLLVISCPCALVLSVPLAYFTGIGRASKSGILFKSGIALETLTKVQTVVLDKTGTLTKGEFQVRNIRSFDSSYKDTEILSLAGSLEKNSNHPIARSIEQKIHQEEISTYETTNSEEMTGRGIVGKINGKQYYFGNITFMREKGINESDIQESNHSVQIYLFDSTHIIGVIEISDVIKDDAASSIRELKRDNIKTAMLTGDVLSSAEFVQKETGIDKVFSNLLPEEKLDKLKEIRKDGPVMFVGDGINDTPVMANADCGAAMGNGSDAAVEISDVVFLNSNVKSIPTSISISKRTNRISKENVIFALTFKALILGLALSGFSNLWLAVFADTGVAILCLLNSMRLLRYKIKNK